MDAGHTDLADCAQSPLLVVFPASLKGILMIAYLPTLVYESWLRSTGFAYASTPAYSDSALGVRSGVLLILVLHYSTSR